MILIANPDSPAIQRELIASTTSFLVFGSVLFLLERLGVPDIILVWSLAASIFAVAILFGYSARTTSGNAFFCDNRSQGLSNLVIGNSAALLSTPLFLLLVYLQSGNSFSVTVIIVAILAGHGLNGWLFSRILRKSGAYSMPDFLGFRYNSKLIRFLTMLMVVAICSAFLFAEIRLAGLYLAPILQFSFEHITAAIVIISAFVSLLGGIGSVSKLQSALVLLILVTVLTTATWLAIEITDNPLPQSLLNFSGTFALSQPLVDIRLARELEFAFGLIEQSGYLLPLLLLLGFIVLPQSANYSMVAKSTIVARRASMRSLILSGLLLSSIPALYYLVAADPVFLNAMPVVLQIFMPVALLMVSISTTSLLLSILANALSHDGYQFLQVSRVPLNRQIFIARIMIILLAYICWKYSINPAFDALPMLVWALGLSLSCLLPVMLVSIIWPGTSALAIVLAIITGLFLMAVSFVGLETEFGRSFTQAWFSSESIVGNYLGILASLIVMIIVIAVIFIVSAIKRPEEAVSEKLKNLRNPGGDIPISANL